MKSISTLILCSLLFIGLGCSNDADKAKAAAPAAQTAVPVKIGKAIRKDMPVQVQAVGTVEAVSSVTIKPQVQGLLLKVHFKEGQDVKKGDLLFTIDPRPYQAELAQAQANLAKDIAQAKNARQLATRYENLVKKDYVTKEQYEQFRTSAEAFEASVDADRAAVENAKLKLNYCTIRSQMNGRTGNLMVHPGNVLKENDTQMVEIHQIDPVYVSFAVPEEHLPEIRKYQGQGSLKIVVTDKSGSNPVNGTLTFLNNEVDANTGTIQLKGTFQNEQHILWPGEFANVTLMLTTRPKATVVPAQAVEAGQEGQYVYVVKSDKTAEVRPVVAGDTINQETIIENGISPGEIVVTDGQLRLIPGVKVEYQETESAS